MIGTIIITAIIFLLGGVAAVFCIRMIIITSTQRRNDKRAGIVRFYSIVHIRGLNAPVNCNSMVYLSPEHLSITCGGQEFLIRLNQITNAEHQVDLDEDQYLTNRNGQLVAKTGRTASCYAIISYESTYGGLSAIILRDKYANRIECLKLINKIKPHIDAQIRQVQL
ncbi:hypothetical protein [Clostridium sp. Marseille-P2415]|uniref:hypothetical protein n=1 Tax=Clostridium sp. Marseille-P2415 TaxID=1805471 RepID=UPI0009882E13|nr:hypothetical protein [Clostridium sp. Marseille-P2415]